MPGPVVAPLIVLDDSVVAEGHLDLAIGHVESQEGDGSSAGYMENQPFGRISLDVEREVRSDAEEIHSSTIGLFYCSCEGSN